MLFEELYETLPGNGWLSKEEAHLLYRYIPLNAEDEYALEVGCYKGRSTVLLAHFFKKVYVVDPFKDFDGRDMTGETILAEFLENMKSRKIENVTLFQQKIEEWDSLPVTFAYLDGDHTYQGTVNQINVALKSKARTIAIHDVNDTGEGVHIKDAALKLLGPWSARVERLAVWVL